MDDQPVSNYDLLKRVEVMEEKLDTIIAMFQQAKGGWTVIKYSGIIFLGIVTFIGYLTDWKLK